MRIDLYRWEEPAPAQSGLLISGPRKRAALFIDGRPVPLLASYTLNSEARGIDTLTVTLAGDIHTHDGPPAPAALPSQPTDGPERGP